MQILGKLMSQFWKNEKQPNFGPNFGPQFFLQVLPLLEGSIVQSHHLMQFKGKLINQTWENGKKKLILSPILACFTQI